MRRITSLASALALLVLLAGCRHIHHVEAEIEKWLAQRTDIAQADVTLGWDADGPRDLTITGQVADVTAAAEFVSDARKRPFSWGDVTPVYALLTWPKGSGQVDFFCRLDASDVVGAWELAASELPAAATSLYVSSHQAFVRYESTDPLTTAAQATGLRGGEIEVTGTEITLRADDETELRARAQGLGRVAQAGIDFTVAHPATVFPTSLDDLLPTARLLGTDPAWHVEYDHEVSFALWLTPEAPNYYHLIEELVATREPGMWVTYGPTEPYGPGDVRAWVSAPSEAWCDDFLASTQAREQRLRLNCPIGPADVPADDLPYAGVEGSVSFVIETMPAVRAAVETGMRAVHLTPTHLLTTFRAEDSWEASIAALRALSWHGDRDFEATIRAADGTRLEVGWTTTATGPARDIHTHEGTDIEAEHVQRLIELWDSSATS